MPSTCSAPTVWPRSADRIVYGGRVSLGVALLGTSVAVVIGTLVGVVSVYYGGWIDTILMRVVDVMLAVPGIFLLILLGSMVQLSPATLSLPSFMLAEAALRFLGFGVQPMTPSWGNMLTNATHYFYSSFPKRRQQRLKVAPISLMLVHAAAEYFWLQSQK